MFFISFFQQTRRSKVDTSLRRRKQENPNLLHNHSVVAFYFEKKRIRHLSVLFRTCFGFAPTAFILSSSINSVYENFPSYAYGASEPSVEASVEGSVKGSAASSRLRPADRNVFSSRLTKTSPVWYKHWVHTLETGRKPSKENKLEKSERLHNRSHGATTTTNTSYRGLR